jgi:hypothetical protein
MLPQAPFQQKPGMNKSLPIIAVLLAGAALLIAMTRGGSVPRPPDTEGLSGARFEQLERNQQALAETLRTLSRRLERLEGGHANQAGSATAPPTGPKVDDLDPAGLARLKQRLDELAARDRAAAKQKEFAEALAIVLDPSQAPHTRVKQAHVLKRGDNLNEQAVRALTDLYRQTDRSDLETRLIVLDALSGSTSAELRDQILVDLSQAVQGADKSGLAGKFRHVAVGALAPMLPDPSVQEWLSYLARNDPNPDIAARAGKLVGLPPPVRAGGK